MPLTWDSSLKIGIEKIDQQHKELIDAINAVLLAMNVGKDPRTVRNLLLEVASITFRHFGYEESCMHRAKCPVAAKNKAMHTHFKEVLAEVQEELLKSGASPALYNRIDQELLDWFGSHIRGIDTQLKAY